MAEGVQEDIIICHRLLDQLDEEECFRRVHDRVHSLLKGLHGIEGSEILADEDDDAMTPLIHGQALDGEETFEVDAELEAILLESIAQGERGETISAEELLREMRSRE